MTQSLYRIYVLPSTRGKKEEQIFKVYADGKVLDMHDKEVKMYWKSRKNNSPYSVYSLPTKKGKSFIIRSSTLFNETWGQENWQKKL